MDDKIVLLDESALDSIVGGAFNQNMVQQLGLEVKTSASGKQGLYIEMQFAERKPYTGWSSEDGLRKTLAEGGAVSLSVKTTSGEMKALSQSEIKALLS